MKPLCTDDGDLNQKHIYPLEKVYRKAEVESRNINMEPLQECVPASVFWPSARRWLYIKRGSKALFAHVRRYNAILYRQVVLRVTRLCHHVIDGHLATTTLLQVVDLEPGGGSVMPSTIAETQQKMRDGRLRRICTFLKSEDLTNGGDKHSVLGMLSHIYSSQIMLIMSGRTGGGGGIKRSRLQWPKHRGLTQPHLHTLHMPSINIHTAGI